ELAVEIVRLPVGFLAPLLGELFEQVISAEIQDFGEYLLAVVGLLLRKLIPPALTKIGGVAEGVVVHPQEPGQMLLGFPGAGPAQRPPAATAVAHLRVP